MLPLSEGVALRESGGERETELLPLPVEDDVALREPVKLSLVKPEVLLLIEPVVLALGEGELDTLPLPL